MRVNILHILLLVVVAFVGCSVPQGEIVESNYLHNAMQPRDAQEFVDFYHEQQDK